MLIGTCARDSELISSAHPLTIMIPFESLFCFCAPTLSKIIHRKLLLCCLLPHPFSYTSSTVLLLAFVSNSANQTPAHLKDPAQCTLCCQSSPVLLNANHVFLWGSLLPIWLSVLIVSFSWYFCLHFSHNVSLISTSCASMMLAWFLAAREKEHWQGRRTHWW